MATWTTSYNTWLTLVVTATESNVNIDSNTSRVNVTVQLKSSSTTRVFALDNQNLSVSIDGTSVHSGTFKYDIYNRGTVTLYSGYRDVTHNSDGSKTASISVSTSGNAGGGSINQSLTLTTIARVSIPTVSASTVSLGSSVKISFNRQSPSFRHNLKYDFAGTSGTLVTTSSNVFEYTWTLPASLANAIPSRTTNGLVFTLTTYNGSTNLGSRTVSISVVVPNNGTYNPSITQPSWSETVSAITQYMSGSIIDGRSRIKFSSTITTRYSATISNVQIKFVKQPSGATYTYNVGTSGNVAEYMWSANSTGGHWSITMIVTDSRGRRVESSALTISITAYDAPRIVTAKANRTSGNATRLSIDATATGNSVNGKNQMTLAIYTKLKTSANWGTAKHTVNTTSGSISLSNYGLTGYLETESYDVRFELFDRLTGAVSSVTNVGTTKVLLGAYRDTGIGIGQMYSPSLGGVLQVGGDIISTGGFEGNMISRKVPAGGNLNNITEAGFYYNNANADVATIANTPNNQAFSLLVEKHAGIKQTYTVYTSGTTETYVRNMYNGTWGAWQEVQFAEMGSNSNGYYIRYMNGMLICWHEMRTSSGANNATGNMFRTNTTQWNFPAHFNSTPIVQANPIGVAAETWAGMGASGVTTTLSSFMVWSSWNRGTGTINVGLFAIGRWRG